MTSTEITPLPNGDVDGPWRSQRGVVEEVISKRLKALTKKIIRIKGYGAQPPQSLNNDQKSAMASLPSLEAVAKELEDLIKPGGPVETAELSQAGILRETRDTARAQAIAIAQAQLDSYSEILSKRLSQFLRLHVLLHPARSWDHQHLTNGDLDLPSHLREQVTPSDILRVGRMHDDIRSGGEAGKKVLQQLGGSAEAMETEDQRVLELLDLLDQPQISVPPSEAGGDTLAQPQFGSTTAAAAAAELEEAEVEELDREARTRQPTDYSVQTRTSDDGLPLGASASQIGGAASRPSDDVVPAAPPALNFLQEDELVEKAADPVEGVSQAVLNEQQPSVDDVPASLAVQNGSTATQPVPAASPKIDWAADDDDDQEPIFSTRATSSVHVAPSPPVDEPITDTPAETQPQTATAEEPETETHAASVPSRPAKPAPRASASSSKRGRGRGGASKQASTRPALPQNPSSQRKVVDDDGFEQVVKKQAQAQGQAQGQGQSQSQAGGRGGSSRGRGDGRGRGGGQRGRGDRGRGLPPKPTLGAGAPLPNGPAGGGPKAKSAEKALFKSDVINGAKQS